VTVIDAGEFGGAASTGNAGWITPSLSGPVPAPGLVATSIRWMLHRDSPLYIKPSAFPRLAPWLFQFWRHCTARDYQAGLEATLALGEDTMERYDALAAAGVDFEMHKDGLLFAVANPQALDHILADLEIMQPYGYEPPRVMQGKELHDFEPNLSSAITRGAWVREERHVRPETLSAGLAQWLTEHGAELMPGTRVTGFRRSRGTISAVATNKGLVEADQVLIAAGVWSGRVAQLAGVRLPMEAGKGYNITVQDPAIHLGQSIYFLETRIACTPFDRALRIAGTMELSGINNALDLRRVEAIRRGANRSLNNWSAGASETVWAGMRPMTPDGVPVIGRAPGYDNLFVAAGHAMMGVSLAPSTARLAAELICDGQTDIDLSPFDPDRFSRTAASGARTGREAPVRGLPEADREVSAPAVTDNGEAAAQPAASSIGTPLADQGQAGESGSDAERMTGA
jgi:D-amino-acid dehydrogenase